MDSIVTLKLTRRDFCILKMATVHICNDYRDEIRDPATTTERRNICCSSLGMWQDLHDDLERQLDEHDKEVAK